MEFIKGAKDIFPPVYLPKKKKKPNVAFQAATHQVQITTSGAFAGQEPGRIKREVLMEEGNLNNKSDCARCVESAKEHEAPKKGCVEPGLGSRLREQGGIQLRAPVLWEQGIVPAWHFLDISWIRTGMIAPSSVPRRTNPTAFPN